MQKASPLYAQIRDYLLEMIQQNRQTPNFRLPSENQLAIKFGASRISAKHALDALEQEGLIYRQQGRGSFIRSSTAPAVAAAKGFFPGGIALITSFISTLFMSDMIQGIREELAARGLESVVFITDNNQEKEVEYITTLLTSSKAKRKVLNPHTYLLRTLRTCYRSMQDSILPQFCLKWTKQGMTVGGRCLTPKTSECRRTVSVCSLSQILEAEVDEKYYLSPEKTQQLLTSL